ncbi:MAG TPA: zinc metalloprotease HtpX [Dehalococcoidia bacterium]|nr:zinc metalloprotease HtpX [Dehalococcoidia bacterium]
MFTMNNLKTLVLMALLTGVLLFVGQFFGGTGGLVIALIFVGIMNFVMYWFSDKIALAAMRSHEVTPEEEPELHAMVDRVVAAAGIPKPKVYISDNPSPNAFATGRNPEHAAIAVTSGIRNLLTPRELEAVIGHELGHVRNRDTLLSTGAGTMAGVITFAARMAMFGAMFGGGGRDRGNMFAQLALILLAPIAAMLIQMAISRSREYQADKTGSEITRDPLALASALSKLEGGNKRLKEAGVLNEQSENPAMAHLFIVSPLAGGGFTSWFSTHPPIEQRIERLQEIANEMGIGGYRTS